MRSRTLRQKQNASDNENGDDSGGHRPTEIQPTLRDRLVEEVADRRTQRPRQDEGRPE
jgi:hypothetical protein